jgi:hypothetical protein
MAGLVAKAKVAERDLDRDSNEELSDPNGPFASIVLDILAGVAA